jgi:hypothetical protein
MILELKKMKYFDIIFFLIFKIYNLTISFINLLMNDIDFVSFILKGN